MLLIILANKSQLASHHSRFGRPPNHSLSVNPLSLTQILTQLNYKLIQEFAYANISASAQQQKFYHDKHFHVHSFVPGVPIWLFIPTRGKLQHKENGISRRSKVKYMSKVLTDK